MLSRTAAVGACLVTALVCTPGATAATRPWVASWAMAPDQPGLLAAGLPFHADAGGRTVRDQVRVTLGGTAVRIRVSNAYGNRPLTIDDARIARSAGAGATVPGTSRSITFGGQARVTVPVGRVLASDAVPMAVSAQSDLAVSLYSAQSTGAVTSGGSLFHTAYVSEPGDSAADDGAASFTTRSRDWYFLTGVDVRPSTPVAGAVVALGASITAGYDSASDANRGWVDLLGRRLLAHRATRGLSIVDPSIAGNNLHEDTGCFGASGLHRLTRDALDQPGARTVILDEGANDITHPAEPSTDPLYACIAHRAIAAPAMIRLYGITIRRIHARHLRVIMATIPPFGRYKYWSPAIERKRLALNRWIRSQRQADGVIDFQRVLADPAAPSRLRPAYDSGDGLHPNDAGHAAMARRIDLTLFQP